MIILIVMVMVIYTYLCSNAAGVRDAAGQWTRCSTVVVHVDGPVCVLLTSTTLKLPQMRKMAEQRQAQKLEEDKKRDQESDGRGYVRRIRDREKGGRDEGEIKKKANNLINNIFQMPVM